MSKIDLYTIIAKIPYAGNCRRNKMNKKIRINKQGVSPLLAVALLVAITVVLAGVLYVSVIGFGSGGDCYSPTMPDENYYQPPDTQPVNYPTTPQPVYTSAAEDQESTFGADVDTGSYVYARNCINYDRVPEPERVRTEEFLNYFDYHYPKHQDDDFKIYTEAGPSYFSDDYHMLKIGIRARSISSEERGPMTLICVIDTSGSMASDGKLNLIKQALPYLVDQLIDGDEFGIVTYGTTAQNYLNPIGVDRKNEILASIEELRTDGSTNAQDGLVKGYEMAQECREQGQPARLLLLSDGVANTGISDVDGLVEMIQQYKEMDIYLSTYGFGMGEYNDELMEQLADNGDGKYGYIDSLDEAKKEFVEDLTGNLVTIARDLKLKLEFNTEIVEEYRLVGYDNRLMTSEEFDDESKDAGDIGAGHTVTALYEFKLVEDAGPGIIATLHLRYKDPETDVSRSQNVEIKTEIIVKDIEDTSPPFRFALTVAEFAEYLQGSGLCDSTLTEIQNFAQDAVDDYVETYEEGTAFVQLVEKARSIEE